MRLVYLRIIFRVEQNRYVYHLIFKTKDEFRNAIHRMFTMSGMYNGADITRDLPIPWLDNVETTSQRQLSDHMLRKQEAIELTKTIRAHIEYSKPIDLDKSFYSRNSLSITRIRICHISPRYHLINVDEYSSLIIKRGICEKDDRKVFGIPAYVPPFSMLFFQKRLTMILMRDILIINKTPFLVIELEIYSYYPKHHEDYYTYRSKYRLKHNEFYFRRDQNRIIEEGRSSGLEICFGNADKKKYYGILIRTLQNLHTEEIIEGPHNVMNEILRLNQFETVSDLVAAIKENSSFNIRKCKYVELKKMPNYVKRDLVYGPRIGLHGIDGVWKYIDYRIVSKIDGRVPVKKKRRKLRPMASMY